MKPTKRKAFNFLRSYFDVYNELKTDEDRLSFLEAVLNKQFLDEDPKGLPFIPNLCYESQRHQIEESVKGWKRGTKNTYMTDPPSDPPSDPKEVQVQVQVQGKGEVQYSRTDPRITPPSEYDFRKYCYESIVGTFGENSWNDKVKGNVINQFKYWSEANWSDGKGKIIKNWQQKARGSFKYFMK